MTLSVLNSDETKVLVSQQDGSINHVYPDGSEFRLVHREDHDTIYLSSHTGCSLGCTFCHLTASGETKMLPLSRNDMIHRASKLLPQATKARLTYAFMARGEALLNEEVDGTLVQALLGASYYRAPKSPGEILNKHARVCVSSIFPALMLKPGLANTLLDRFGGFQPSYYWSLYSLREEFRREWMPRAGDPRVIAKELKKLQDVTHQDIVIHHALIEHENGNAKTLEASRITNLLDEANLRYRVNLVQYNPSDKMAGTCPSEGVYKLHEEIYFSSFNCTGVKIQPRVGYDAFCSCGMFASGDGLSVMSKVEGAV